MTACPTDYGETDAGGDGEEEDGSRGGGGEEASECVGGWV